MALRAKGGLGVTGQGLKHRVAQLSLRVLRGCRDHLGYSFPLPTRKLMATEVTASALVRYTGSKWQGSHPAAQAYSQQPRQRWDKAGRRLGTLGGCGDGVGSVG